MTVEVPSDATMHHVAFELESIRTARSLVTDELESLGVARGDIEMVNLVVGELVMNGLQHGRPLSGDGLEVAWWTREETFGFSVRDGGQAEQLEAKMPGPRDEGGRGLGIVSRVCQSWSWDAQHGTRVLVELPIS